VEEGRRAVGLDPLSFVARWALGLALLHADKLDEAESVLEEAAAMSGRHQYALGTLARNCARRGGTARASTSGSLYSFCSRVTLARIHALRSGRTIAYRRRATSTTSCVRFGTIRMR
jgi:predicted Zn-dependent protease